MRGKDGHNYYLGNLPNHALIEGPFSLLRLALGMAQSLGAPVSMAMVEEVMGHVVATGATPEFGIPRLPSEHTPGDLPIQFVKHLWPKLRAALDFYEVPVTQRATALGFAIQHALELGKDALDPLLAVKIVMECAAPMAKLDPKRLF